MKKVLALVFSLSILGAVVVFAQGNNDPYFSATKSGHALPRQLLVIQPDASVNAGTDAGTRDAGTSPSPATQKSKP